MSYKFSKEEINELIGVTDSSLAPKKLMDTLFNEQDRNKLFQRFLNVSKDLSEDWFGQYFEIKKPKSVQHEFNGDESRIEDCELFASMDPVSGMSNEDYGAGTGGNTIAVWQDDLKQTYPVSYEPEKYLYVCKEEFDEMIPFLLFNLSIRGMNGIVWHGDYWERECKGVFITRNMKNCSSAYSDIKIFPCTDENARVFFVEKWIDHKEYSKYATNSTYKLGESNIDRMIALEKMFKPSRHFSRLREKNEMEMGLIYGNGSNLRNC